MSLQNRSTYPFRVLLILGTLAVTGCQTSTPQPAPIRVIDRDLTASISTEQSTAPKATATPALSRGINWQQRVFPLYEKARLLVEQETNIPLGHVKVSLAQDAKISTEVGFETGRLINKQFSNKQFAQHFLSTVMNSQSGTYAALYSTRQKEVMLSKGLLDNYQRSLPNDVDIQDAALLALLIHELVHAADDVRYGIHENRELNFRASFAQSAAFEGHAQHVTRNICAKANCLHGLKALDEFMFSRPNPPNQLTQSVQAISRNVLEYSYIEGERFMNNLASRPNGKALIDHVLTNPPQDPIQILDPQSYPDTEREARNKHLLQTNASVRHPWQQGAWANVQTSPLKGVNLRADPSKRDAAVDGFTRLITAMVAVQQYDQTQPQRPPNELMLISTDNAETAALFAQTLHDNTAEPNAIMRNSVAKVSNNQSQPFAIDRYITDVVGDVLSDTNNRYFTVVASAGNYVVQISGYGNSSTLFVDYTNKLLLQLHRKNTNS